MNESGAHLNLVLNESGSDRLVLDSWWSGAVTRERPDLLNVGQAKPRLRALCILFLLAKHRETQAASPDGISVFQAKIEKGTWICTLANDFANVAEWVKARFHIRDNEMFLFASPGSTHNKGGKEYPSVRFNPQRLSLSNLHLHVSDSLDKQRRLLHHDELIPFALKVESQHWTKSAIKSLYSDPPKGVKVAQLSQTAAVQKNEMPNDALFLEFAKEVLQTEPDSQVSQSKSHLDACFQALFDREIECYRGDSEPFFAYIRDKRASALTAEGSLMLTWNQQQVVVLCSNCYWYAQASIFEMIHCLFNQVSGTEKFLALFNESHIESFAEDCPKLLWEAYKPDLDINEMYFRKSHLVPELEKWEDLLHSGASGRNNNYPITIGTFMVYQIVLTDFIEKVFVPSILSDVDKQWIAGHLVSSVSKLKEEIALNKVLVQRYCQQSKDFNNALQAGKLVLKAQAEFWKALHRRLVTLEN